jgi:hypothetical protein
LRSFRLFELPTWADTGTVSAEWPQARSPKQSKRKGGGGRDLWQLRGCGARLARWCAGDLREDYRNQGSGRRLRGGGETSILSMSGDTLDPRNNPSKAAHRDARNPHPPPLDPNPSANAEIVAEIRSGRMELPGGEERASSSLSRARSLALYNARRTRPARVNPRLPRRTFALRRRFVDATPGWALMRDGDDGLLPAALRRKPETLVSHEGWGGTRETGSAERRRVLCG